MTSKSRDESGWNHAHPMDPAREVAALAAARVGDAHLRPAVIVSDDISLRRAVLEMKEASGTCILVRFPADEDGPAGGETGRPRLGILTDQDMRDHAIIAGVPPDSPVGPLARPIQFVVGPDLALFDALPLLTHDVGRRVVVVDGEDVLGVLELSDALALLANNSHGITLAIERARTPDALIEPGRDIDKLVRVLHGTGVRTAFIGQMVTVLNRRLMKRLFTLIAPPMLAENACLFVMGSEGRGEQLVKTDQDNGLILRDGVTIPELPEILGRFTDAMVSCGYPRCPGEVMVSNPRWSKSLEGHRRSISGWIRSGDETGLMNLAILFDATSVAGDSALLDAAKEHLSAEIGDDQGFFLNFARPIRNFETPTFAGVAAWFGYPGRTPIDVKKAAIFPLVHGARAYALRHRLTATATADRLRALADRRILGPALVSDLIEALDFLGRLRLDARLRGWTVERGNLVEPATLSPGDHERLKKSMRRVRQFKRTVAQHFRLDAH